MPVGERNQLEQGLKMLTDFCAWLPLMSMAGETGFCRRTPKKLTPMVFVQATVLLVSQGAVSLRRWAVVVGLLLSVTLSKQALWERLNDSAVKFLQRVLGAILSVKASGATGIVSKALECFKRVLVQDSTTVQVSARLAKAFPGGRNQHGTQTGQLKIQAILDLKSQQFVDFQLSHFRRNDQAAAFDILSSVRKGDLVLRDLGYFVLGSLEKIVQAEAFFLSRLRVSTGIWDAQGRKPLKLLKQLRRCGNLDRNVTLGDSRLPVRLVAVKLPAQVAAERRRRARAAQAHDGRYRVQARTLALMDWALFVTNVPASIWSAKTVAAVYGLRWRIETIFKAWKSHFRLTEVTDGTPEQLKAVIYGRLIFLSVWAQVCGQHWLRAEARPDQPARSMLKVAAMLGELFLVLCLEAWKLPVTSAFILQLSYHTRYERRTRLSFEQKLTNLP